jgi:acyl carrier protein
MAYSSVYDAVVTIIAGHLDVEKSDITRESHLFNDLGGDSLDATEIQMQLEEESDIIIDPEDGESLLIVGDIVDYLEANGATVGGSSGDNTCDSNDEDNTNNGGSSMSNFNLTQYCPTVDDWWNAYVSSGLKPTTSTPETFISNILGPNATYQNRCYSGICNNVCVDGTALSSMQYCVYMGEYIKSDGFIYWNDGFITKITGSQLATMTNANRTQRHILIPSLFYAFMNINGTTRYGALPAPNFLCTYFSGGATSSYSVTFDLPILPLPSGNGEVVVNRFGGNMMTATVAYAKPSMIFWKKVTRNDIDYLCPAYQITWNSSTDSTPSSFRKIIIDKELYELIDACRTVI